MPTFGNSTQLLNKEQQAAGYYLTEDEDFVYLIKEGKKTVVFSAHSSVLPAIDEVIRVQEAN